MSFQKRTNEPRKDPYALLDVDREASDKEIKRAYFKMVRLYPPEREPEKFQEIRAAYETVRTPEKRAQTDLFLFQPPPRTPNRRAPSYDTTIHIEDMIHLALGIALDEVSISADFHEPKLPT